MHPEHLSIMATRSPNTPGNKNTEPERDPNAPSPTRPQQPPAGGTRQGTPDERTEQRPDGTPTSPGRGNIPPGGIAPDAGSTTGRPIQADPGDLDDEDSGGATRSSHTGNEPPDR